MGSNETIKQAVTSGLGIAILSAHTLADELCAGRLIALRCTGTPIMRKWYLCHFADRRPNRTTERVRDRICPEAESIFPKIAFDK